MGMQLMWLSCLVPAWARRPGEGSQPQPSCGQRSGARWEGDLPALALPCVTLSWVTSSALEIKD